MRVCRLLLLLAAAARGETAPEVLRFALSRDVIEHGFRMPIDQTQSVSEYVMGTVIRGTALTRGKLSLELVPAAGAGVVNLRLDTVTESHTVGRNEPRRNLSVHIHATAHTRMTTTKPLYLYPDRILTGPVRSHADTRLTYHGVRADAEGIFFPRLRERVAYRKAWETANALKRQNEERASRKIAGEMNATVERKAAPLVGQLDDFYRRYFYHPLFGGGRLPGRFALTTSAHALSALLLLPGAAPEAAPAMANLPLGLRVHESFPNRVAEGLLGGRSLDEEAVEEFLIRHGVPAGLGRYRPGDDQVVVKFCSRDPFVLKAEGGRVAVTLCAESVSLGGRDLGPGRITTGYALGLSPEGSLVATREGTPRTTLAAEAAPEVERRYARLFPPRFEAGRFTLPLKGAPPRELKVHSFAARRGWLVLGWRMTGGGR